MRWPIIVALSLSLPMSALAAAPSSGQASSPGAIVEPAPFPPGQVFHSNSSYVPGMVEASGMGMGISNPVKPPGMTAHSMTKEGRMAAPTVSIVPSTAPPLDLMQPGAQRLTTEADVAASVSAMNERLLGNQMRHGKKPLETKGSGFNKLAVNPMDSNPLAGMPPLPSNIKLAPLASSLTDAQKHLQEQAKEARAPSTGCQASSDINELLSPACLQMLKGLDVEASAQPPPPPGLSSFMPAPPATGGTKCSLVMFGTRSPVAPAVFETKTLRECLAMASRMSYGQPGTSNITAVDPIYGLVAVTCRRPAPDGTSIVCKAQP